MGLHVVRSVTIDCDGCKNPIPANAHQILDATYYGIILCSNCYESLPLGEWFRITGDRDKNVSLRTWKEIAERQ